MTTRTSDRHALGTTLLRLIVGVTFAAHGAMKLFSFGLAGTAGFLGTLGVPMASVMAPAAAGLPPSATARTRSTAMVPARARGLASFSSGSV